MLTKRLTSLFVIALLLLAICSPAVFAQVNNANDGGGAGAYAGVGGSCCGGIIGLAISGAIFYWVYNDANSRGANGILWGLIAVFVPCFIGLIAYFVTRPEKRV